MFWGNVHCTWSVLKATWRFTRWRRVAAGPTLHHLPLCGRRLLDVPRAVARAAYTAHRVQSMQFRDRLTVRVPPNQKLLPHQQEAVNLISTAWNTTRVCALHLPFGSGKTRVAFAVFEAAQHLLYITLPSLVHQVQQQLCSYFAGTGGGSQWVVLHQPRTLTPFKCIVLDEYTVVVRQRRFRQLLASTNPGTRWLLLTGEPDSGPLITFRNLLTQATQSPPPHCIVRLDSTNLPLREPERRTVWFDMDAGQRARYTVMVVEATLGAGSSYALLQTHRAEVSRWKIPHVVALVRAVRPGTKCAVFSEFNTTLAELSAQLRSVGYSTAVCFGTTVQHRTAAVRAFTTDTSCQTILLASVRTSSRGFNLGNVNLLILADSFYHLQDTRQTGARIVRLDSTASEQVVVQLVHRDTFEAALYRSNQTSVGAVGVVEHSTGR